MPIRFSLRAALFAITLFCFAFAGLSHSNVWWASAWFSFAIAMLVVLAVAIAYRRAAGRAFCIGYVVCGGVYFALVYAPVLNRTIGYRLVTTKVLVASEFAFKNAALKPDYWILRQTLDNPFTPPGKTREGGAIIVSLPQWAYFSMVGHSIFTLLFGLFGGWYAAYLRATRDGKPSQPQQ